MPNLTIISCTNRPHSRSLAVARVYASVSAQSWDSVDTQSLERLNGLTITADMYSPEGQLPEIVDIQNNVFIPSKNFVFVLPEYNGTFPGTFKYLIDAISIRDKDANFKDKNVALIGIASGRSGNLRGLDHLANALNYLGMHTYHHKIPLSQIQHILDSGGNLDEGTTKLLENHSAQFRDFCK